MYTEGYKNAGDLYKAKTFRTTQDSLSSHASIFTNFN